ncbi:MAG TPA: CoB--CoM heterodisulfide reductase iron-sulfur subunit A family protein [Terriglobia bacterium]|nr:CoB--CoM heterodisulfide reductase iron-sulfur subunit A family protein [Terriglobia bacterium]
MNGNGNKPVKIGVYVCHCGTNIAAKVDVKAVAESAATLPGVVVSREYKYMCSDPGQDLIGKDTKQFGLNRIVVASCSPHLHELTFRKATENAGENPYLFHLVNIREHVSWVSDDKEAATEKAKALVKAAVARVFWHQELKPRRSPVNANVLIVGGGIAGIHSALTLASAGKQVYLVERQPSIGGHMAQFDKTFPTLDCAACILTPKMTAVKQHPNIHLLTLSEASQVSGFVGNFKVKVKRYPRYIDEAKCVGCGECIEMCVYKDAKYPNDFDMGLGNRKPIYLPFPQAVPPVPLIDRAACIEFKSHKCPKGCVKVCGDRNAIDFTQTVREIELEVGTIIMATGFKTFEPRRLPQYGYGKFPNVYTSLEIERLVNASGPTLGQVVMRDGKKPQAIGILHCIGSRDENTNRYCSRVCCMYSLKLAHLLKEKTGAHIYNFYIDMRTPGKGFEEFYKRVLEEGVSFIRGRVAEVSSWAQNPAEEGKMILRVEDTLLGIVRRIPVDMVVLSVGMEAQADTENVRRLFNLGCSSEGWFLERHPKLAPVDTFTDGIFLAGCCQGPKDIPDTVAQAGAAAAQSMALIDRGFVEMEPNTAWIEEELCSGCHVCVGMCPYSAIHFDSEKHVAALNEALCKGCGTCVAACPSGAAQQNLFRDEQLFAEVEGVLV